MTLHVKFKFTNDYQSIIHKRFQELCDIFCDYRNGVDEPKNVQRRELYRMDVLLPDGRELSNANFVTSREWIWQYK
jgi:hypothetical protein